MWGVELAELDNFNKAEVSKSKAFFSRETDRYRNPYGRKPVNVVRQCVFVGSVNHATYLKDDTGNRRFWPVKIGDIDLTKLKADRDKLWAEAVHEYKNGTLWHVTAEEFNLFKEEQERRYVGDAYEDTIRLWLDSDGDTPSGKPGHVTVGDILGKALGLERSRWTLAEQQRVGRIMARIGWPKKRVRRSGVLQWVYVRPEEEGEEEF